VAVGDSDNDVKMLSMCGYGIAVGNASGPAKEAADYVSKAPHSEGVAEGLDQLGMLDNGEGKARSVNSHAMNGI
jgi:hydroxymethylpyrimidine pyrophosphatase-like HAD family hydrolase